jgi:hypothetical protein
VVAFFSNFFYNSPLNKDILPNFLKKRWIEYHFMEAKEPVKGTLLRLNLKQIRFGNPHPCNGKNISFINLNNLSSTWFLICKPS